MSIFHLNSLSNNLKNSGNDMYTIESTNLEKLRVPNGTPKDMRYYIINQFKKYNKPFEIIRNETDVLMIKLKHPNADTKIYYWTFAK